jgi:hypothetical protein
MRLIGSAALLDDGIAGGRFGSAGVLRISIPAPRSAVVWFSVWVIVFCDPWSLSAAASGATIAWWPAWVFRVEGPARGEC